jgi:hypothetical protein
MYPPHKEALLAQKPYRSLPSIETPDALAPTLTDITTTTTVAAQRRQRSPTINDREPSKRDIDEP